MSLDPIKWIAGMHIGRGIAKLFHNVKEGIAKSAVAITETIKTATEGSLVQTLASFLDGALKTHLASDVVSFIHSATLKALAIELAIEGLPDNATEEDILKFENAVINAITNLDPRGQSKLWTTLAAQIWEHLHEALGENDDLTFAEIVGIIEDSYQDYLKDKEDANND